jgi:septum formation protein
VPEVEELEYGPPHEVAVENAYRKAAAVANGDGVVLGVDTVVALDGAMYGKPRDSDEARATLSALSGRRHTVIGGLCLMSANARSGTGGATTAAARAGAATTGAAMTRAATPGAATPGAARAGAATTAAATTAVTFRRLDGELLGWYVRTGEWRDRAGAYAIQGRGAALVKSIEGDYLNVVGLPVALLLELAPELLA